MEIPMKEVDVGAVRVVSRAEGWHDFIYIPGKYFVTIPARAPESYPFRTITSRGEQRSYRATIPARDAEAGGMLLAAVLRAAELCGRGRRNENESRPDSRRTGCCSSNRVCCQRQKR
jgi:hypothetical protein